MYETLRRTRKETHTPIRVLTKLLDLKTEAAYLKKENGERKFSVDDAFKLAKYFKKSIEELFNTTELSRKDNSRLSNTEN